jgi:hypothetical protein
MKQAALAAIAVAFGALFTGSLNAMAAPVVEPRRDLGHAVIITKDFQLYFLSNGPVVFSAILPPDWSYSIYVDGDKDGIWGHGPYAKGNKAEPKGDFGYGQTDTGKICTQYVYSSYSVDRDIIYSASECGKYKSAATFHTKILSDTQTLKVYTIPRSELSASPGSVHFVIEVWDGQGSQIFGSAASPFLLTL